MKGSEKQIRWAEDIKANQMGAAQEQNYRAKTMRVKIDGEMQEFEVIHFQVLIQSALETLLKNKEITLEQFRDARRSVVNTEVMKVWSEHAETFVEAKWWIDNRDENINLKIARLAAKNFI